MNAQSYSSLGSCRAPRSQRGVVLVIGLIFLLILTLVGVSAMRGTTLQERMAGNYGEVSIAFQLAENVVRYAEGDLVANGSDIIRENNSGFFQLDEPAGGVDLMAFKDDCTAKSLTDPPADGGAGITPVDDPNNFGSYLLVEISRRTLEDGTSEASTCVPVGGEGGGLTGDTTGKGGRHFWVLANAYGRAARGGNQADAAVEGQGSRVDLHTLYTLLGGDNI